MLITESNIMHKKSPFTMLVLDGSIPSEKWDKVAVDGEYYKPELLPYSDNNVVLIDGAHDYTGFNIEFIV